MKSNATARSERNEAIEVHRIADDDGARAFNPRVGAKSEFR